MRTDTSQRGFSLIEIMVGIVIGMIAVLVIYQVFAAAEGIKRNTTSVGDAQQNGLLSSFMLNIELANANNGMAFAMKELGTCPATVDPATTFRPIPVLIRDGGADDVPDSMVISYSAAQRLVAPAPFLASAAAGADYAVQSPLGFKTDDLVLAISLAGDCQISRVTGVTAPDVNGMVTVSHTGATVGFSTDSVLLDLGPKSQNQRVAYDVSGGVLRSTHLWDANGAAAAAAPNPIASNVVNLKVVYGIDNGAGGVTWTAATGQWSEANVLAANISQLGKIRAVRIGIVVRGEQWDKNAGNYTWTLFDGAVQRTGTINAAGGNYRYRVYETTIPLRNPIWNPVS